MTAGSQSDGWLELSVEVDHEAVEPVSELFSRFGFNQGVVIEEPFTQDPDGDNLAVDLSRPVAVRTYVAAADVDPRDIEQIRTALWHLGRMRQVGELTVQPRREEDWANAWKEHYRPVRVGTRVIVRPPWLEHEAADDSIEVVLDPGMAFGTGTHPSTRLCMLALEEVLRPGQTVLDVGTGSGILAIAAAKLGAASVLAVDIEPVAVRSAIENVERNGTDDRVAVAIGTADERTAAAGPYDIVLANIISRVLVELAPALSECIKPGGTLVLSGIIEGREASVRESFEPRGLRLQSRRQMEDWVSLTYARPDESF